APVREDGSVDWDGAYEAVARNISQHGVNLLQEQIHSSGKVLIGLPSGEEVLYVPAEVRHFRTLAGNVVELGCRFQAAASAPEKADEPAKEAMHQAVGALLEQLRGPAAVPDERRAHPRVPFHGRLEVRQPGRPPAIGFARDLSKGGVSFLATVALPF